MTFILSEARRSPASVAEAFARYRNYLQANHELFPSGALELASASWYFDPSDHRSPHDARLVSMAIMESRNEADLGSVELSVLLRNAYADATLSFTYHGVSGYALDFANGSAGHCDWRYDEFRLTDDGKVVHEIEWFGVTRTSRWKIIASDVVFAVQGD